ncbi:MAG: hypothetical protein ACYTG1_02950 [Planctomycetota bacterium]|jgi:hypothetical protein
MPMKSDLARIARGLRDVAKRYEADASRDVKPEHLGRNIHDRDVQAASLFMEAIDAGAFPEARAAVNHGWWDRRQGRLPGGPVTVYGTLDETLLTSARIDLPNGTSVHFESDMDEAVRQEALDRYRVDAAADLRPDQLHWCWIFTVGWLVQTRPSEFRHDAARWDWSHVLRGASGRPVGKDGKPLRQRWYKDGVPLPDDFRPRPGMEPGKYSIRLVSAPAHETDRHDHADSLAVLRRRAEVHGDACRLLAEMIAPERSSRGDAGGPPVQSGLVVGDLATRLGVVTRTVNTWAKKAGVPTPGPGRRNFIYPWVDVRKICAEIIGSSSELKIRQAASEVVAEMEKKRKDGR